MPLFSMMLSPYLFLLFLFFSPTPSYIAFVVFCIVEPQEMRYALFMGVPVFVGLVLLQQLYLFFAKEFSGGSSYSLQGMLLFSLAMFLLLCLLFSVLGAAVLMLVFGCSLLLWLLERGKV